MEQISILQQIEQKLNCNLKKIVQLNNRLRFFPPNKLYSNSNIEYTVNRNDDVIGLKIENINCSNILSLISRLRSLEYLTLTNTNIEDITPIQYLKRLKILNLHNNRIYDISPLKELTKLIRLELSSNLIKELPNWITDFEMDIAWSNNHYYSHLYDDVQPVSFESFPIPHIYISNNAIETPPINIVRQGKNAIKNYFDQILKEKGATLRLFEAKILVIGDGGTGKTTFVRKIKNANADMPEKQDTTLGIDVGKWLFETLIDSDQITFHVNLWDFGGQKIYHGTHQIFFTYNSFYVLVADTREQTTDFAYWLNTVEQLGGEDSSLLIILNNKFGHLLKFDETGFRSHFGKLIKDVIQIDLKNDTSAIIKLQDTIKSYLKLLPGIGEPLPKSWVKIREVLLEENSYFITFNRFRELCASHKIEDSNVIHTLSGYFTRIGVFTHYIDDILLQDRIYLNSNWLVKTVYKILDNENVKEKKGRINETVIKNIWQQNELQYEINKLTQLMHKFGLMYKIPNKAEYIVPAHLPTAMPYAKWEFSDKKDVLQFRFEFDKYMPRGLMSRLIVSIHHHIKNHDLVWHRGVNLELNGAFAEIVETYESTNFFHIRIFGNNKRELLAIIRERFEQVLEPFVNLKYSQLVPCICNECLNTSDPYFYKYTDLLRRIETGKKRTIECVKSTDDVKLKELIDGITPQTNNDDLNIAKLPLVVILTAIQEEYMAVKNQLVNIEEAIKNDTSYEIGIFNYNKKDVAKVIIRECGQRNIVSAQEAERAIQFFNPDCMFFVGIAGSRKPNDFSIGDVIFPEKAYYYEGGKFFKDSFKSRPDLANSDFSLIEIAKRERRKNDWKVLIKNNWEKDIKADLGIIASGENLVEHYDSEIGKIITEHFNDTSAIEMEGFGFSKAANRQGRETSNMLIGIVRGISDIIGQTEINHEEIKNDRRPANAKIIASDTASAFTFWLIYKTYGKESN
jgi:internalin A